MATRSHRRGGRAHGRAGHDVRGRVAGRARRAARRPAPPTGWSAWRGGRHLTVLLTLHQVDVSADQPRCRGSPGRPRRRSRSGLGAARSRRPAGYLHIGRQRAGWATAGLVDPATMRLASQYGCRADYAGPRGVGRPLRAHGQRRVPGRGEPADPGADRGRGRARARSLNLVWDRRRPRMLWVTLAARDLRTWSSSRSPHDFHHRAGRAGCSRARRWRNDAQAEGYVAALNRAGDAAGRTYNTRTPNGSSASVPVPEVAVNRGVPALSLLRIWERRSPASMGMPIDLAGHGNPVTITVTLERRCRIQYSVHRITQHPDRGVPARCAHRRAARRPRQWVLPAAPWSPGPRKA